MAEKQTNNIEEELGYDPLSFGRYLRALRLEKGIKIESIAAETRINLQTLRVIEAEDHDGLPDEVFVKGFLRAYANIVGANPDETVQRYLANCHVRRQAMRFEANLIRSGERFWPRLLLSLAALACIIIGSVVLTSQPDTPKTAAHRRPAASSASAPENPTPARLPAPPAKPVVSPEEPLSLGIVAVGETWMKIIIDDQSPKAYSLNPGDRLEFKAQEGINLLIGNAAGVQLMFNEEPLPISGKQGQAITLQLP